MTDFRRNPVLGGWRATFVLATVLGSGSATAATFTVNGTGDASDLVPGDGACSTAGAVCTLRAAIEEANAFTGADVISFNIGSGLVTIAPGSTLPTITSRITLDGTTQPGFAGTPIVELDVTTAGPHGLTLGPGSSFSLIRGLVINRASNVAIRVFSANNVLAGNYLGTDPTGTLARPNAIGVFIQAAGNRIGGTAVSDRNVISGNTADGVQLSGAGATGNLVQGNYIGLDATGTLALGNGSQGIAVFGGATNNTIGGTTIASGNVISANGNDGILIAGAGTTGNHVERNFIGTDAPGGAAMGNLRGVEIDAAAAGNFVGNTAFNGLNRIVFNLTVGVGLTASAGSGNLIVGNEIYDNGGLGIDLGVDGVTPNDLGDGDSGPNDLQNYPFLSGATSNGAEVLVAGALHGAPSTNYRIDFYAGVPDPSGFGEGDGPIGVANVMTDVSGLAVICAVVPFGIIGDPVTATATDPSNSTSEFGNLVTIGDSLLVTTTSDTVDGATTSVSNLIATPGADGCISFREAILAANATPGTDSIRFGIPLTDPNHFYYRDDAVLNALTAVAPTVLANADISDFDPDYPAGLARSWYRIRPTSALPTITDAVAIDGPTQPGYLTGAPVVELDGTLTGPAQGLTLSGSASSASTIRGLVIDSFAGDAIRTLASSANNVIVGNYLGTDPSGKLAKGNQRGAFLTTSGNLFGGLTGVERNLVSGNLGNGIEIGGTGNQVQGNDIGVDVTGKIALGNGGSGVAFSAGAVNNTIGGPTAAAGNVISGNGMDGVRSNGAANSANRAEGNLIGTDRAGVFPIGNALSGVAILSGTMDTVARNVVAFNGGDGIVVSGAGVTGHALLGNSTFSNAGLGIDLENDGVTPNDALDADTGANDHLNFPVLTSAVESAGSLSVSFQLDVPAGWYRIEFFKNPAGGDPSGFGEGQIFASSTNVNHPGGGATSFNHSFGGAFGDLLTATATFCTDGATCAAFGSTSELGNAITAVGGATLSSTSNQSFTVGDPSTPMFASDIVVSAAGVITTTNDIRIRIPSGYPMRWNPAQTSLVRAGTAALKVAPTVLGFEDSGRTVVVDVTSDFNSGDQLTLSGLMFFSFTAPAPAASLELETANDGLAIAFDDKTKLILTDAVPTLSSDDDQTFVTGQPPTLTVPFTVSEGLSPSITFGNDIRVRIPASLSMTWDPGVTMPFFFGPGATKVAGTVSFEDFDRTLVIDVQTDFVSGDFLTVSGLYFQGFGASPPSNLELEVDNLGGVIDLDDKTIQVDLATDVPVFTATATAMQVKLEWVYPAGNCNFVRIVRDTGGFPAANDPTLVDDIPCGTAGTKGSIVDSPLTPNTTYFYSAYVDHGAGYTAGRFLKARPFDSPPSIHWAYSTGATSMAPPGLRFASPDSFVYLASNDGVLHSIRGGSLGGDWPGAWTPYVLGGPAQNRFPVVSFSVGGGNGAAFLGSQDGRVYAVDAVNGTLTWDEPVASMVQAAPAGHFQFYAPAAFDLLLVGTRDSSGANSFDALDVDTGTPTWSFVNSVGQGGNGAALGIISGSASVDYPQNRAYFASRAHPTGSSHTLWCVTFNATSVTRLWSQPLGNIDGSPILMNGRVYVGTNGGVLYALDAATGALKWSLALGDGPIKGFPFPAGTSKLFLSTNGKVWSVVDNGASGSVSPGWPVTSIPSPSIPLPVPGTTHVLVGSSDGKLYQLDAITPLPPKSVTLGDGSAAVGAPTLDLLKMLLYMGTDAGIVYGVTYPIP